MVYVINQDSFDTELHREWFVWGLDWA